MRGSLQQWSLLSAAAIQSELRKLYGTLGKSPSSGIPIGVVGLLPFIIQGCIIKSTINVMTLSQAIECYLRIDICPGSVEFCKKFVVLAIFAIFVAQSFITEQEKFLLPLGFYQICGLHEALHELFHFCDFSYSKKNSRYFICEICYFFYTFLIAVVFTSFLLKLRKELVSKLLLTRSILDIGDLLEV